jgi:PAS domain S-box-containing protein
MVNARAEAVFGYRRADLLGAPIEMLLPAWHRSDHHRVRATFFNDPQTIQIGVGHNFQALRNDGTEFPVEIVLSAIDAVDGTKALASIIDVTERRDAQRMQAYLAALVESSADAIIAKDLNGIVTSWNKAAEQIFGFTADEMIGQLILILIPADHVNEEEQILERLRKGRRVEPF